MSVPSPLQQIVDTFASAPKMLRLQLLLEYAGKVPPLPPELADARERMERVPECHTPLFVASEVGENGRVSLYFDAPQEAPTTRGFSGILSEGLHGQPAEALLATDDDFYLAMGLGELISPLRLRGMSGILHRLKRQVRDATGGA
jgi:cysteine desulfuration protein SufE